ncbi:MAG TPA: MaoC/PaaZ C-terminal domain-containing protein [Novosphingobium sp.]|nr:MaoC/PaaZ C-terminal domain-containing protein [Novosphingobium sp.]
MNLDQVLNMPPAITRGTYDKRDTMLYALGVGVGPGVGTGTDPEDLRFVYEEGLIALPTMAVVVAGGRFWLKDPQFAIDWKRILHGEQSVEFHRTLPVAGTVRSEATVDRVIDKGAQKGALLYIKRRIFDDASDELLATVMQAIFLRGDGGCGGSDGPQPVPHPVPAAEPDRAVRFETRPEQALLYRLSGDYNPLHADPAIAAEAGYPRPILHGLCTYGMAGRAILKELCGNDPARMKRLDCRFSAPVFPGETVEVLIWREGVEGGVGRAAFQAYVREREALVLNNGYAEYLA